MEITRKEFLGGLVSAVVLAACGSGEEDDDPTPDGEEKTSCTMNGTSVEIASNHGHTLTVSKADVSAAAEKTDDIMGTSAHKHMLTISAAQFAMLKDNTSISVTSTASSDGHTHKINVLCA